MRLADVVAADRVVVPLRAATVADATRDLVARLVGSGAVADPEKLRLRVEEDRPEDIVALGDRAFLLHYRTDAVADLAVAIGTARTPVCRSAEAGEGQCARILFLVTAPPRLAARYLQVVGAFARLLSRPDVVEAVLAATTAEQLAAIPAFADAQLPEQLLVRDVMTPRPISVGADVPVRDAAMQLVRRRLNAVPVLEADGQLIGLLTDREVIRHLLVSYLQGPTSARTVSDAGRTVRDVMTRQVLCVSPEQPLADVASLMANKDVERVPVVREGHLVGFLTRGDIVRKLLGS